MYRTIALTLLLTLNPLGNASTLVHNITGYTLGEGELVRFIGLEFDGSQVTRLYASAAALATSTAQQQIDGQGATMLPGLIDAHGHLLAYGQSLDAVDLTGSHSESEAAARVFAAANTKGQWILGRGWNQVLWEHRTFPTRASLDRLADARPIVLQRVDGHAVWVNSAALQQAGIDDTTPDPEGGQIIRDPRGHATGLLIDNAMQLVLAKIPPLSDPAMAEYQLAAMRKLASFGLTAIQDAGSSARELRSLQSLSQRLPIRIYAMLDMLDPDNLDYLRQHNPPLMDPQQKLLVRSVKISVDGALGSRGAALFEDYSDQPGHRGLLLLDDQQLGTQLSRAMLAGYQVNLHAIGDQANARALDYLERAINQTGSRGLRHRIEHAQILRLADIPRFARANILASIQPTHATSDKNMAQDRLGEERLAGAYAWKKLLASGAVLAGGSDFPVESPNPFFGLHAAVTRQDQDNQPAGGWLPEEKLSRSEALSLFTEGAAYAAHQEHTLGRLLPGYEADFILVRDDYFRVPVEDIWKNQVLATWVAGQKVFGARGSE